MRVLTWFCAILLVVGPHMGCKTEPKNKSRFEALKAEKALSGVTAPVLAFTKIAAGLRGGATEKIEVTVESSSVSWWRQRCGLPQTDPNLRR